MTGDGCKWYLGFAGGGYFYRDGRGDDATRQVTDVVLLDSNFGSLPSLFLKAAESLTILPDPQRLLYQDDLYSLLVSFVLYLTVSNVPIYSTTNHLNWFGNWKNYQLSSFPLKRTIGKSRGRFLPTAIKRALLIGILVIVRMLYLFGFLGQHFLSALDIARIDVLFVWSESAALRWWNLVSHLIVYAFLLSYYNDFPQAALLRSDYSTSFCIIRRHDSSNSCVQFTIMMLCNVLLWRPLA